MNHYKITIGIIAITYLVIIIVCFTRCDFIKGISLPEHNKKFARKPTIEELNYRPTPEGMDLDRIFFLKKMRQVYEDHTISYKGRKLRFFSRRQDLVLPGHM